MSWFAADGRSGGRGERITGRAGGLAEAVGRDGRGGFGRPLEGAERELSGASSCCTGGGSGVWTGEREGIIEEMEGGLKIIPVPVLVETSRMRARASLQV